MKSQHWVLGALAIIAGGYYLWQFADSVTPSSLAAKALSASDGRARVTAAAELAMMANPAALPALQRVANDSKDLEVLAISLSSVVERVNDKSSLPLFLTYLEHESLKVRELAFRGVLKLSSISLEKTDYQPDAPPETRGPAARKLQDDCRELQITWANPLSSEARARVRLAAVSTPDNPTPKTKDESIDAGKKVPTPSVAPSPQPTPESFSSSIPISENPGIRLVAWACRGLGALAVLAEVIAAVNLLLGDLGGADKKKKTKTTAAAEELGSARGAGAVRQEFSKLFNGLVYGVALFIVAELILLAATFTQTAVRIEQKLDYSQRGR